MSLLLERLLYRVLGRLLHDEELAIKHSGAPIAASSGATCSGLRRTRATSAHPESRLQSSASTQVVQLQDNPSPLRVEVMDTWNGRYQNQRPSDIGCTSKDVAAHRIDSLPQE
ncbi:hypothetical protein H4582DRAFT_2057782 [Lactarius indigo]|nr:hypothetical protein H4582DRAFT_2057782 [Lactarius indigo]